MRGVMQSMLPTMLLSMLVLPLASAASVHRALSGDEEARMSAFMRFFFASSRRLAALYFSE